MDLNILLPIALAIPLLSSLIIILIRHNVISYLLTVATSLFILCIYLYILFNIQNTGLKYVFGDFSPLTGIEYQLDFLSLFFCIIISTVSLLVSLWSFLDVKNHLNNNKSYTFFALLLINIFGFSGLAMSNDLFNIFVFFEISSLATYSLISIGKNKAAALFALRYLIVGTISASFYVLGVGILYMMYGVLNIDLLILAMNIQENQQNPLLYFSIALITAGIFAKIALFPTFWWLPKTYSLAPSATSAFLAGIGTKISILVFIKVVVMIFAQSLESGLWIVLNLIIVLSLVNIFLAGWLALKYSSITLILAFSSISQIGYIMLGLGLFNVEGIISAFIILFSHALVKCGLFLSSGNLRIQYNTDDMHLLKDVKYKDPISFFLIIFLLLSLSGIPGTSLFWGKLYLVIAGLKSTFWIIGVLVLLSGILSFVYTFKVIYNIWSNNSNQQIKATPLPIYMYLPVAIICLTSLLITIYPKIIISFAENILLYSIAQG